MGYTTVSTYSTFNMSPTTINLLRIEGEYLTKSLAKLEKYLFLLASKIWQVNTINQNEAKLLFHGHRPLHARRRFIGKL